MNVTELETEISFVMKKRDPEYQSHVLKVEEKLVREEARAKGLEEVG